MSSLTGSHHGETVWVFNSAMLANDSKRLLHRKSPRTYSILYNSFPRQWLTNNIIGPPDHRQESVVGLSKHVKLYSDIQVGSVCAAHI